MIDWLRCLISNSSKINDVKPTKRKIYRLRYAEPITQRTSKTDKSHKPRRTKRKLTKRESSKAEGVEDVERAVELVKEAAMYLLCPFCKARLVDEIEYLLRYHYKTVLIESGVEPKEADKLFKERYEGVVERRVDQIRKELGVNEYEYKEAVAEKAKALIGKP